MSSQDPHTWTPAGKSGSYPIAMEFSWCQDCGALRIVTAVMSGAAGIASTTINLPSEYHTCGTSRRRA